MNIYLLIARRFLFPRNSFRSNTINFISFVGLFIGAASIVLSISVLNGFQGILQNEAKKLYGDYLVEDLQNLNFKNTSQDLNIDKINSAFEDFSKKNKILEVSREKLVSIDFNHNPASSIVDTSLTNVVGKNMGKISAWYDNEWGFSNRMCDIVEYLHKIS